MRHLRPLLWVAISIPAWGAYSLTTAQERALATWLLAHPEFRAATDADCRCEDDLQRLRSGWGGMAAIPDYHPHRVSEDFNADGLLDFAVLVIDPRLQVKHGTLLIFNARSEGVYGDPAFLGAGLEPFGRRLVYIRGSEHPLAFGGFYTDSFVSLTPDGAGYKVVDSGF